MKLTIYRIQRAVCSYYYVRHNEMLSNRRGRDIARPRQIAMYLARELTPHSFPSIGRFFGRDHTTVMHAIHRVEELLAANWEIDEDLQELRERLAPPDTKSVDGSLENHIHAPERGKEHFRNGQEERLIA